jgi:hypothetical protein
MVRLMNDYSIEKGDRRFLKVADGDTMGEWAYLYSAKTDSCYQDLLIGLRDRKHPEWAHMSISAGALIMRVAGIHQYRKGLPKDKFGDDPNSKISGDSILRSIPFRADVDAPVMPFSH